MDLDAPPLVTNALDEAQLQHADRVDRQQTDRRRAALQAVLKTREGRYVLWELIQQCGVYRPSPAAADLYEVSRDLGRRDVGLELLALIRRTDPERYLEMEREARNRQTHQDRATLAHRRPSPTDTEESPEYV